MPDAYRRGQPVEFGPLRPLRQWLLAVHQGRWPEALEPALAALESEAGFRTVQRAMTFEELGRLAVGNEVDFGVHTVSHPVLPLLGDDELAAEIRNCHAELRERLPRVLPVLAIPFGLFDARTARLARQAGMEASLSLGSNSLAHPLPDEVLPRLSVSRGLTSARLRLRLLGVTTIADRFRGRPVAAYPGPPLALDLTVTPPAGRRRRGTTPGLAGR